ncbi:hypothetical protein [Streptomyces sp. JNUCC 63]
MPAAADRAVTDQAVRLVRAGTPAARGWAAALADAWHARRRDGGTEALRSKGPSGRPPRMRPAWRAWPEAEPAKGPAAHGRTEDQQWTLERVAIVIARRFHVRLRARRES